MAVTFTKSYYHTPDDTTAYNTVTWVSVTSTIWEDINKYYIPFWTANYELLSDNFTSSNIWNDVYTTSELQTRWLALYDLGSTPVPTTITVSVYNKAGDTLIHTFDDVYSDSTISTLINSGDIPGVTALSTTINGTALSTDTVLVDWTSYYDVTPVPQTYIKKIYHENQEYIVWIWGDSSDITYDNTESGMTADNVQDAIDELQDSIDWLSNNKYIESADSSNYKVSVVSTLPSTQVTNTIYIVTG